LNVGAPGAASVGVSGSTSSPLNFNVDQDYCPDRSAYQYLYDPATKSSSVTSLPGTVLVGVTDPIPDLNTIIDPGKQILSNDAETKLQPNGSDASRLLTRAFGVGACDQGVAIKTSAPYYLLESVYYVINIVRWSSTKNPPQAKGSQEPYQIASNDWYLFNTQDGSVQKQTPFH